MKIKNTAAFFALFFMLLINVAAWADATPAPTMKTVPQEEKIGKRVSEALEKQFTRVHDPATEARLNIIVKSLTPYLERELKYNIRIIELEDPNAFSLPGGQMYITTGMLEFLKSDAELSAVIAHELIHADRAHGIIQSRRNNKLSLLTLAGVIAAAAAGAPEAAVVASAIHTAAINSYSIDLEKEADAKGIAAMHKAGYNPAAMLTMMERLNMERLRHPRYDPGIFQTHPDDTERIEAAVKYMKEQGIEVQRRDAVGALKIEVAAVSGDLRLTIDEDVILSLPQSAESEKFLTDMGKKLDETLALELAPYDIQVHGLSPDRSLIIRGKFILREAEMFEGQPSLEDIREKIAESLAKTRRKNPLTNYYQ